MSDQNRWTWVDQVTRGRVLVQGYSEVCTLRGIILGHTFLLLLAGPCSAPAHRKFPHASSFILPTLVSCPFGG